MREALIGPVGGTDFRFTPEAVVAAIEAVIPGVRFFPARPEEVPSTLGQVAVPTSDEQFPLVLDILTGGQGASVECFDPHVAAQTIWALTQMSGFPTDGVLAILGWAQDQMPLTPDLTVADLEAVSTWSPVLDEPPVP